MIFSITGVASGPQGTLALMSSGVTNSTACSKSRMVRSSWFNWPGRPVLGHCRWASSIASSRSEPSTT